MKQVVTAEIDVNNGRGELGYGRGELYLCQMRNLCSYGRGGRGREERYLMQMFRLCSE